MVAGIDADARFMCDDEEVGSHDGDPGPFVEYMTREIPPHRTSASAGEESGGGERPASGGEANLIMIGLMLERKYHFVKHLPGRGLVWPAPASDRGYSLQTDN